MKIDESNHERLVIKDFPWALGLCCAVVGSALIFIGIHVLVQHPTQDKILGVSALVGALFLLVGAVFTKRSVFIFDLEQQQLTWSRIGLTGWKGGTVAFGRITGCVVQEIVERGEENSTRLALTSPDGDIPLTESYRIGGEGERQKICEAIHTALGLPPPGPESITPTPVPDSVPGGDDPIKALIAEGKIIAAIQLLRKQRGCSLKEAKDIVDAMK